MLRAILSAILTFPLFHEDVHAEEKRAQLEAIANAIDAVVQTADEAAFLLAWGNVETNFSLRIQRGECKQWECDGGKARGPWQTHRNGMSDERWSQMVGVENVKVQAEQALRHACWALQACPNDRIRGAFRVLSGRGCSWPLKGEAQRVSTFKWARQMLLAAPASPERQSQPTQQHQVGATSQLNFGGPGSSEPLHKHSTKSEARWWRQLFSDPPSVLSPKFVTESRTALRAASSC